MYRKATATAMSVLLTVFIVSAIVQSATAATIWTEETRLTTWPYFDGIPSVAQAMDGKMWAVWQQDVFGNFTIVYQTSFDNGLSWSDVNTLVWDPEYCNSNDQSPSIFGAKDGRLWLVWSSDRPPPPTTEDLTIDASPKSLTIPQGENDTSIISVTSINNFNDPVDLMVVFLPENVTATLDPTEVTPPPNGTATSTLTVMVETTATPGNYTFAVIAKSGILSPVVEIDLEITELGTLGYTTRPLTTASPTQSQYYHIFYKTSSDYGASWSDDIQLTTYKSDNLSPSVFVAADGKVWLVWHSYRPDNYEIFYKTFDGISWSGDTALTTDPNADKLACIAQTADSRIWVVWCSDRYGDWEIFYKTFDGTSWSNATRLTTDTDEDKDPTMVQMRNGIIHIMWQSCTPTSTSDLYYKTSNNNGANWSESIQFTTDNYEDIWPVITRTASVNFNSAREFWVMWASDRADQPYGNWDIWYKKTIALPGDVNEDGVVDIEDLVLVALAWGTGPGDPRWNLMADLNEDNFIDIVDLATVGSHIGQQL